MRREGTNAWTQTLTWLNHSLEWRQGRQIKEKKGQKLPKFLVLALTKIRNRGSWGGEWWEHRGEDGWRNNWLRFQDSGLEVRYPNEDVHQGIDYASWGSGWRKLHQKYIQKDIFTSDKRWDITQGLEGSKSGYRYMYIFKFGNRKLNDSYLMAIIISTK